MRYRYLFAFALSSAAVVVLVAQEPEKVPASTQTLHVSTRLVGLDVVVEDKQGRAITNLSKDDFTILDDGVIQNARSFEPPSRHVLPGSAGSTSSEALADTPLTILLYDELNTRFEDTATVRLALENYLRSQSAVMQQPTMLVALNDAGYQMLANYTQDPHVLMAALKAHKTLLPSRLMRNDAESRLADTFSALRQLALATRGLGERKNIVWIGNGFPSINVELLEPGPQKVLTDAARNITNLLLDSRISISKIDPRANDSAAPVYSADAMGEAYVEGFDPYEASFGFNTFVQQTGGKYIYGRNDFEASMQKIVSNDSAYYTLTYRPSTLNNGQEYHQIAVRLKNPDLIVSTRQGYYAETGEAALTPDQRALNDLASAASSSMVYDALGLRMAEFTRNIEAGSATCVIALDGSAIRWQTDAEGTSTADLIVAFSTFAANGKMLSYTSHRIDLRIAKTATSDKALAHPAFRFDTPLADKSVRLRVVALQQVSGRFGSTELSPVPTAKR